MIKSGFFIGHTADRNLDIGFIPDLFMYFEMEDTTSPNISIWMDEMQNNEAAGDKEGIYMDGSTPAAFVYNADSQGITRYDTSAMKAMIPAYDGEGLTPATIYGTYAAAKAANATPTNRATTTIGTVIRPTTANGFVYECQSGAAAMGSLTEPTTWPVVPGETVSDGTITWICRAENLKKVGHKGVTIAAEIQTNGKYSYWTAFKSVQHKDAGDSADW